MDLNDLRTNFHIQMNAWWNKLVSEGHPSFSTTVEVWQIHWQDEKLEILRKGEVIANVKDESIFLKDSVKHAFDFPLEFLKQSVTQQLQPCYTK